ncbi:MAG: tetratricopeptide repeat protein [Gallionella sp.]
MAKIQDLRLKLMNILKRFSQTHFAQIYLRATILITALLLGAGAHADELHDATQLFKHGQQTQALKKVNNYLSNKPKDAQGRFLKGLIITELNRTSEAIKIFSDLTHDFPDLPEPYNNLAVLYASQGQYEKAKSSLELAIRTHPSYATAHENLGDIYAKMASQAYSRALKLDSGNTTTKTKLAMIQNLFSAQHQINSTQNSRPGAAVKAKNNNLAIAKRKTPSAARIDTVATAGKTKNPALSDLAVKQAVHAWAAAWSSKNIKQYLSYYAADFKPRNGKSHASWAKMRKSRISKPKHIKVRLSHIQVSFSNASHATVKFHQNYHASNFKSHNSKILRMVKSGQSWFIQEERSH